MELNLCQKYSLIYKLLPPHSTVRIRIRPSACAFDRPHSYSTVRIRIRPHTTFRLRPSTLDLPWSAFDRTSFCLRIPSPLAHSTVRRAFDHPLSTFSFTVRIWLSAFDLQLHHPLFIRISHYTVRIASASDIYQPLTLQHSIIRPSYILYCVPHSHSTVRISTLSWQAIIYLRLPKVL